MLVSSLVIANLLKCETPKHPPFEMVPFENMETEDVPVTIHQHGMLYQEIENLRLLTFILQFGLFMSHLL